ncbi:polysaccharide deacetylase family protein [Puia sp.]|jgi:cellulose synthase/poly-beta-1,6-N-acetylglucosamine synthase-like glycosyltransferase/spore germination protein YaaH/peptidoglycan/xylan/chitin deacetylase (PgdA/CDA1 family)|uniref:polysaccharide deacetylase family protein n=1 Tax=Puia sp. TaxID=2045100 RepID=UPI002F42C04F
MTGNSTPPSTTQIFQTNSTGRWQRLKWGGRILLLFAVLGVVIFSIAVSRDYKPALPRMKEQSQLYKKVLDTNKSFLFKNPLIEQYGGFRKYINEKVPYRGGAFPGQSKKDSERLAQLRLRKADTNFRSFTKFPAGIRAAFYVDWDAQSFLSLQQYIDKMNLVVPEWIFIDPTADTIYTDIDARAWGVMKKSGVKILPILSNNYKELFRGDAVHRIINDPVKKQRLINDLIRILEKDNFVGVNVDFEELEEKSNEKLVEFQKDLFEQLHARHLLVTQDVIPFNEDYNVKLLSKYNDYVFLMAYDQYSDNSGPGPISHQKWIEGAVDDAVKYIPENKLILCLAAYGYDWRLGKEMSSRTVSYQQALFTAKDNDAKIDFDNDSYNLHYDYDDEDNVRHQVQFTDAATAFNALRFATEYGLAGTSIWRLGDEDPRIWDFYDQDMQKSAVAHFNFSAFSKVDAMAYADFVDYEGSGEVLDVIGTPTNGRITPEVNTGEMLISEESYDSLPSRFVARKYGTTDSMKLVLTFDDGPDPDYTPKILDILSKYHVPATFFIVGINAENNIPIVKREFKEGHEIGNHTFTHPNIAKVSTRRAILEMESTRLLIECITGRSTIMFRAPYNADFEPEKWEELIPVAIARKKNYLDIGESIDPLDWEPGTPADSIYERVIRRKNEMTRSGLSGNIILLHDAGGDGREATVEALPRIIEHFQKRGFHFTTVADILSKTKDEMMPPVPRGSGYYLLQINYYFAEIGYWGSHILFSAFVVFMILSASRVVFIAVIATKEHFREKKYGFHPFWLLDGRRAPLVSIIVPAYNEEVNAVGSVQSLLNGDYPNFEIIFVNDGSQDQTFQRVSDAFANNPKVKVFTKPNGGKASALNFGISRSDAEFVICIDADTKLLPNAVSLMMEHFGERKGMPSQHTGPVGAVAGNVKVGNQVNVLTRWQAIEYISSQNFDRRAFSYLNAITVVPGAIGAFRKKAIEEAGGFTHDTLAEDCDLTMRILRCGYVIENDNRAVAMTEAPETLKQFFKQRFRWSYGVMQTFWKNRDALMNWKYRWLGWVALPNILIFQYIIPFVIPLADFFMIVGLLTGNASKIAGYYVVFMLIDLAVALLAFSFEREKLIRLFWLIPQRLIWRWLTWLVLFRAVRRALKGELQHWGVLKRTGNVKAV